MIKKIAALLATVVIIGSAASVSAMHTYTEHGDWNYGAIPFVWVYSEYTDFSYKYWRSSVSDPYNNTIRSIWVSSGWAWSSKGYCFDGVNRAYYNFKN